MNFRLLFLDNLGGGELLMVVFFVLLFFGSDKIPGIMRGLGKAMRQFNTAMDDVKSDIESSVKEPANQLKEAVEIAIKEPVNSVTRNVSNAINPIENQDTTALSDPEDQQK